MLKDTMQLSHFVKGKFPLGKESLNINEGLPNHLLKILKRDYKIKNKKIGILGLAFKSDVDDIRDSLSFKLIRELKKKKLKTFISDEFFYHPESITKEELIKKSDVIIVAVPHSKYKNIKVPKKKILIDTWDIVKQDN